MSTEVTREEFDALSARVNIILDFIRDHDLPIDLTPEFQEFRKQQYASVGLEDLYHHRHLLENRFRSQVGMSLLPEPSSSP